MLKGIPRKSIAEKVERIEKDEAAGHFIDATEKMLVVTWKSLLEREDQVEILTRQHHECSSKQAAVGMYLQSLRASVAAAKDGYLIGETRALEAMLADLERAAMGNWPVDADQVKRIADELDEGGIKP